MMLPVVLPVRNALPEPFLQFMVSQNARCALLESTMSFKEKLEHMIHLLLQLLIVSTALLENSQMKEQVYVVIKDRSPYMGNIQTLRLVLSLTLKFLLCVALKEIFGLGAKN